MLQLAPLHRDLQRYSRTERVLRIGSLQLTGSSLGTPRCRLASDLMMLASTAKAFTLGQTCLHATTQHFIKQPAKQIAVPETAMPVLGESRMIGHFIFKTQSAEPAISQVQMGLFTQSPFGAKCHSNSRRSACESSVRDQSTDAQSGYGNRRGNGAGRLDQDTDQCCAEGDWLGCDLVVLMLVSICSSFAAFPPIWPVAPMTNGLEVTGMIFFLVVLI